MPLSHARAYRRIHARAGRPSTSSDCNPFHPSSQQQQFTTWRLRSQDSNNLIQPVPAFGGRRYHPQARDGALATRVTHPRTPSAACSLVKSSSSSQLHWQPTHIAQASFPTTLRTSHSLSFHLSNTLTARLSLNPLSPNLVAYLFTLDFYSLDRYCIPLDSHVHHKGCKTTALCCFVRDLDVLAYTDVDVNLV